MATDKQKAFVEFYLGEAKGDPELAKTMAGYGADTSVGSIFGAKGVTDLIQEKMPQYMMRYSPKAMHTILDIMNGDEILGAKEKFTAAKDWLDRNGFKSSEKVELKAETPLFIMPAKRPQDDD